MSWPVNRTPQRSHVLEGETPAELSATSIHSRWAKLPSVLPSPLEGEGSGVRGCDDLLPSLNATKSTEAQIQYAQTIMFFA